MAGNLAESGNEFQGDVKNGKEALLFCKKEAKNFYPLGCVAQLARRALPIPARPTTGWEAWMRAERPGKVFWFFSSEKNFLLYFAVLAKRISVCVIRVPARNVPRRLPATFDLPAIRL